jgi:hypothetical protein
VTAAAANIGIVYEYVPGVTSAVTFSVRVGSSGGQSSYINRTSGAALFGGASRATLTLEEITAT